MSGVTFVSSLKRITWESINLNQMAQLMVEVINVIQK